MTLIIASLGRSTLSENLGNQVGPDEPSGCRVLRFDRGEPFSIAL
jgi:hypothetical protein